MHFDSLGAGGNFTDCNSSPRIIDDLARLDFAQIRCADQVEGAAFGSQDIGTIQLSEAQRPKAVGVAHADQLVPLIRSSENAP